MDRNLILSTAALGLLTAEAPALAQQQPEPAAQQGEEGPGTEHLHFPGYEGGSERSSLMLEVAPEIISHDPLGVGEQTTNALDLTLVFATTQPIGSGIEIEFDAGATKMIDNGSSSALAANVELRTRPGASGLSAFAGYHVAREYTDFFDEGEATTQVFTTGLRFGRAIGKTEIGFALEPRWELSTEEADEHLAVNLLGEVITPLVGDDILLVFAATGERRWYEHEDPVLLAKRRDWRLATYLGLDLAGLVDPRHRWLHDLTIGAEWLTVSSNVDDAEGSELAFLPAVAIGISF